MSDLPEQESSVGSGEPQSDGNKTDNPSTPNFDESNQTFRPAESAPNGDPVDGQDDPDPVGDEHVDGIVGPERPMPDDEKRDFKGTERDLEESGVDIIDPGPADKATSFTVSVDNHVVNVETDNDLAHEPESRPSMTDISDDDIQRLQRIVSEDASRRATVVPRPFEGIDLESLLVLQNQIRSEIASR